MKCYDGGMKQKGFTIVELIVIIVVIAILVAITIVSYNGVQRSGMDAKIRSTVKTAGDGIALKEGRNEARPTQGYFNVSGGVDTLVPTYLKTGYRDGITSVNATNSINILKMYSCADGGSGFVIYASLNNPTDEDTTSFSKIKSACGQTNSQVPSGSGVNPAYNYAQIF